jgi:hypothetical protein
MGADRTGCLVLVYLYNVSASLKARYSSWLVAFKLVLYNQDLRTSSILPLLVMISHYLSKQAHYKTEYNRQDSNYKIKRN